MNYLQLLFWDQVKLLNKIVRTQHANQIATNPGLRIFLSLKTSIDSIFEHLFDLLPSWFPSWPKNKVCRAQTEPQLLLKDQDLDQLGLQDIRLKSVVHKTKTKAQLTPRNSEHLLLLKLLLNVQTCSKSDETCFVVFNTKCTSTRIKD